MMKSRFRSQLKAAPASMPAGASVLQRSFVYGQTPVLSGNCEACGPTATNRTRDAGSASSTGASFGHHFSHVRVHADEFSPEGLQLPRSDGPAHPLTIKGQVLGDESASEETSETSAASAEETVAAPSESPVETGGANCPITAVFSSTLAGQEKSGCRIPQNQFGAATLARFTLHGVQPGAGSSTVTEQFKSLKDNYSVFGLLKPNTYTTSGNIFDDCYILASTKPLPSDLELQVEQNHLLNGQIISKNIITYTPDRVSIRSCKRLPGSCDFASVCRR